jgi:hypothetical protein
VLIQNKHNPKIFGRSIECILIGYSTDSKAYICYDKLSRRVLTSYHVKFIESHQTVPKPLHPGKIANAEKEPPNNLPFVVNDEDDDDDQEEAPSTPEPSQRSLQILPLVVLAESPGRAERRGCDAQ